MFHYSMYFKFLCCNGLEMQLIASITDSHTENMGTDQIDMYINYISAN